MSGIYIKGLKMPTACCACPCNYDNVCAITNKYPTFEEWYEIKPSWCPLVPVPDHGRLVDADALMENAQYKGTHDILTAWDVVAAPTIIPADKDGAE